MNHNEVFIVAAVADNGVIGADGAIPWHISEDFRRLKALTMGKPLVMGRKTFESLPGLLPGRRHIVIFGGAGLFAEALPLADRIELTEVHLSPAGDVLFPLFDRNQWTETFREHHPAQARTPAFDFVTLLRQPRG